MIGGVSSDRIGSDRWSSETVRSKHALMYMYTHVHTHLLTRTSTARDGVSAGTWSLMTEVMGCI